MMWNINVDYIVIKMSDKGACDNSNDDNKVCGYNYSCIGCRGSKLIVCQPVPINKTVCPVRYHA